MRPFFPDSLDVEELYDRISGAGRYLGEDDGKDDGRRVVATVVDGKSSPATPSSHSSSSTTRPAGLIDLPDDVVSTSIAPYLRARSLHSLRCVNRKLRASLRGVVPGLRLKLFHHQVRSLEWMETRERQSVTEGDVLVRRRDRDGGAVGEIACGGDRHRAVTGGATVLLRPRRRPADADAGGGGGGGYDGGGGGYNDGDDGDARLWRGGAGAALRFDSESGRRLVYSDCKARRNTLCARGG